MTETKVNFEAAAKLTQSTGFVLWVAKSLSDILEEDMTTLEKQMANRLKEMGILEESKN